MVKELAAACHRAGLRFGLYYSQPNGHHPDAFADRHANYLSFLKLQVRELLTQYGPVDIFWFAGLGKKAKDYDAEALNSMIRQLQPRILINNRDGLPEDFDTPEQVVGKFQYNRPWESCITICNQWAWKPNDQMKSLTQCLETLIRCAGGDGNLLFNEMAAATMARLGIRASDFGFPSAFGLLSGTLLFTTAVLAGKIVLCSRML